MAHCERETSLVDVVLANIAEIKTMQASCVGESELARECLARCLDMAQELLHDMLVTPVTRRLWLPRQESLDEHVRRASVRRQLGLPPV